jgi:dTDP-4-dehydrorhamnose 3,5-epimerase
MKILENPFKNAFVLQTEPYIDHRGKFGRIYCQDELKQIGHYKQIVQINHSLTRKSGAIRGMHFQHPPKAEIKMVKCLRGSVFDVIVDLRRDSDTLLQWYGEILSDDNLKMMYVPEGFAHGFQTLEEKTELLYLHTEFYSPEHEGGVRYNDPRLNISWPVEVTEVSEKDQEYPLLPNDFEGIIPQ